MHLKEEFLLQFAEVEMARIALQIKSLSLLSELSEFGRHFQSVKLTPERISMNVGVSDKFCVCSNGENKVVH